MRNLLEESKIFSTSCTVVRNGIEYRTYENVFVKIGDKEYTIGRCDEGVNNLHHSVRMGRYDDIWGLVSERCTLYDTDEKFEARIKKIQREYNKAIR